MKLDKPPYSIDDIRKADSDSWLKGATGEYRKTFVARTAYTLFGLLMLAMGIILLCMSFLPFLGPPKIYPVAIFSILLSIFFVPISFVTTYRFWQHALDGIVKVTVPKFLLIISSFTILFSSVWLATNPVEWPVNIFPNLSTVTSKIVKVRNIQGVPDRSEVILGETWDFYGNSYIQYDRNGNVKHIYNAGDLKNIVSTRNVAARRRSSTVQDDEIK